MQPAVVQTTQKLSQSKAVYSAVEAISAAGDGALDEAWADGLREVCGPLEREMPVEERPEVLWRWLRRLQEVAGLKVDGRSYYGCFRADTKGSAQVEAELLKVIDAELPAQLDWAMNLGKVRDMREI